MKLRTRFTLTDLFSSQGPGVAGHPTQWAEETALLGARETHPKSPSWWDAEPQVSVSLSLP